MKAIELSDLPEALRDHVSQELKAREGSTLIGCIVHESQPWKDKSKVLTRYCAYTEWANLCTAYQMSIGDSGLSGKLHIDEMLAGDILYFMKNYDGLKGR